MQGLGRLESQSIKNAVIERFRRRKAGAVQDEETAVVPAQRRDDMVVAADPLPNVDDPRNYPEINTELEQFDGIYDPDRHYYYGGNDNETAGIMKRMQHELVFDPYMPTQKVIKIRKYKQEPYAPMHMLRDKFTSIYINPGPNEGGFIHNAPPVLPKNERYGGDRTGGVINPNEFD